MTYPLRPRAEALLRALQAGEELHHAAGGWTLLPSGERVDGQTVSRLREGGILENVMFGNSFGVWRLSEEGVRAYEMAPKVTA